MKKIKKKNIKANVNIDVVADVAISLSLALGVPIGTGLMLAYYTELDKKENNNEIDRGTAIVVTGDNAELIGYDWVRKDEVSDGIKYSIHTGEDEIIPVIDDKTTDVYFINDINSKDKAIKKASELVKENGSISEYDSETKTLKLIRNK